MASQPTTAGPAAGTAVPPATGSRAPERPVDAARTTAGDEVTPQMRVQMMATEHWSLLASRALAWNESFTRAGMFLSTLSFAVVALALVGQATAFGQDFRLFALVVLPVVLFLGIATSLRMDSANHHDAMCVVGMNRIRAGYLELAPDLERFFVMGTTDDVRGIQTTMAVLPHRSTIVNMLGASPTLIAVLNSVLLASIAALGMIQFEAGTAGALLAGGVAFVFALCGWAWITRRTLTHVIAEYQPIFPGPDSP